MLAVIPGDHAQMSSEFSVWLPFTLSPPAAMHSTGTPEGNSPSHAAPSPSHQPTPPQQQQQQQKHNNPSYYSFRTTLAGEVDLLMKQLAPQLLPSDLWQWYMIRAGRSALSNSYATYIQNYVKAFGNRLLYVREVGRSFLQVVFKRSLLSW